MFSRRRLRRTQRRGRPDLSSTRVFVLGFAFKWPISRARRQMRGDRIMCLGLRTYRTSCINATDSICRRARMESQSVVKLGQCARVDDKSNRSRSACGNATCGTFQHFRIAPSSLVRDDKSRRSPVCVWQRHLRDRPRPTAP